MLEAVGTEYTDSWPCRRTSNKLLRFGLKQQPGRLWSASVLESCRAHRIRGWSAQRANKVERFHPDKVTVAALIYLQQRPNGDNSQRPSIC